jgi:LexA-binding, inner membrane-associated putative hydrolase
MNEIIHLLTGYLIAFLMRKERENKYFNNGRFEVIFCGISALLPDLVEFLTPGRPHGSWTHTIIFGTLMAIVYASLTFVAGRKLFRKQGIFYLRLILLSWLCVMSHLVLDTFTHQKFRCTEAVANGLHIYFWPIWDQSFHLDCLFGWSYLTRALIEWAFYIPLVLIFLIYRKKKYQENPFHCLNYHNWFKIEANHENIEAKTPVQENLGSYIGLGILIYSLPIIYLIIMIL